MSLTQAEVLSIIIAIAALVIAMLTFYYTYLQKGKIKVLRPLSFSVERLPPSGQANTNIYLPLTFVNTGARIHSISNLKLQISKDDSKSVDSPWDTDVDTISPDKKERKEHLATQISIKGRESETKIPVFSSAYKFDIGNYLIKLLGRVDNGNWERFLYLSVVISSPQAQAIDKGGIHSLPMKG